MDGCRTGAHFSSGGDLNGDEEGRLSDRSQDGFPRNGGVIGHNRRDHQSRDGSVHDQGAIDGLEGDVAAGSANGGTGWGERSQDSTVNI